VKLFPPLPGEDEIEDMIHAISAPHTADPFLTRQPVLWRDPTNPAEQALTPFDEWVYRREQKDLD
jgi:hypothetical protein